MHSTLVTSCCFVLIGFAFCSTVSPRSNSNAQLNSLPIKPLLHKFVCSTKKYRQCINFALREVSLSKASYVNEVSTQVVARYSQIVLEITNRVLHECDKQPSFRSIKLIKYSNMSKLRAVSWRKLCFSLEYSETGTLRVTSNTVREEDGFHYIFIQ